MTVYKQCLVKSFFFYYLFHIYVLCLYSMYIMVNKVDQTFNKCKNEFPW